MRTAIAIFMLLHGAAHTVGFAVSWRLVHSPEVPYRTTIAGGAIDLGDAGIRAYSLLWIVAALAFVFVASQVALRAAGWPAVAIVVATASGLLCLMNLPEARIGLAVNVAIIAFAVLAARYGWLAPTAG